MIISGVNKNKIWFDIVALKKKHDTSTNLEGIISEKYVFWEYKT